MSHVHGLTYPIHRGIGTCALQCKEFQLLRNLCEFMLLHIFAKPIVFMVFGINTLQSFNILYGMN